METPVLPAWQCAFLGRRVRGEVEGVGVAEEADGAAGVDEDDVLAGLEVPAADEVDQPRHALAGVDGVEQHALLLGDELHRVDHALGGDAVALADVVAVGDDVLGADGAGGEAEVVGGAGGEREDVGLLLLPRRADADAEDGDRRC